MNLFKINPRYSLILKHDNTLLCNCNNKKMIKITINDSEVKILKNILKKEFFEKDNSSIFKKLLNKKVIIKCDNVSSNRNTASYLEVYTDSKIDMSQLENKVVLVVGLGGIGCEIITHLVGNGIKNFVILDYDKVDETNLNRQYLFSYSDLQKSKTNLVFKKIMEKKPNSNVKIYNKFVDDYKELQNIMEDEKVDMVVCAADTPFLKIRISVLEACINTNTPCIFGGVSILTGQYGPTFINTNKMKIYLNNLNTVSNIVCCNNINKASFGPTNTIISAYMSIDILMTLLNRKKYINSLNRIKSLNFITRNDYEEKKF